MIEMSEKERIEQDKEPDQGYDPDYWNAEPAKSVMPSDWIVGILFSLIPFVGFFAVVIVFGETHKKRGWGLLVATCLIVAVMSSFAISVPWHPIRDKSKEAEVKSNAHAVQIALERCRIDHNGLLPTSLQELKPDYLTVFPTNPFTHQPTREIPFGSADYVGELTYVPYVKDGTVKGYYLLGYGNEKDAGLDVNLDGVNDHVIIVLQNGDENESYSKQAVQESVVLPDLKDLLKGSTGG